MTAIFKANNEDAELVGRLVIKPLQKVNATGGCPRSSKCVRQEIVESVESVKFLVKFGVLIRNAIFENRCSKTQI